MLSLAKLKIHIKDFADAKSFRFVFYSILNIVNRRVHLPQGIFANDITRMAREPHLEPYMVCNGVFIDVGANVGMWTIYMAKKGVRAYAFEPSPHPFRVLENLNTKYPNIVPLPYALGEKSYLAKLSLHRASGHNGLVKQTHDFSGRQISIQVRTLDSFNIQNVGLIKIDTKATKSQY